LPTVKIHLLHQPLLLTDLLDELVVLPLGADDLERFDGRNTSSSLLERSDKRRVGVGGCWS